MMLYEVPIDDRIEPETPRTSEGSIERLQRESAATVQIVTTCGLEELGPRGVVYLRTIMRRGGDPVATFGNSWSGL